MATTTTSLSSDASKLKNAQIPDSLNLSSFSVLPYQQHSLTVSLSFFNSAYPIPYAEQIASEIITHIQKSCTYKTEVEASLRKNIILKFKPRLITKIKHSMLALPIPCTYKILDEIVVSCLRDLVF